jgi:hypothetical protein
VNLYACRLLARIVGAIADAANGPTAGVPGAITVGGTTAYLSEQPDAIKRHEWVHVLQAARCCPRWLRWLPVRTQAWIGMPRFEAAYVIEHFGHGYDGNKYEIEARAAE